MHSSITSPLLGALLVLSFHAHGESARPAKISAAQTTTSEVAFKREMNAIPAYPTISRRKGEEGRTVLRVLVDIEGLPKEVLLHSSSGFPRLDNSAMEAVSRWQFYPARKLDKPVEAWVLIPIQFRLEDPPSDKPGEQSFP